MYGGYGYAAPEESIYSLIPPEEVIVQKPPMHRSMHKGTVPPTSSTFGHSQTSHPIATNIAGEAAEKVVAPKSARTFGKVPGASKSNPADFMKKQAHTKPVAQLADVKREDPTLLQPTVLKPKLKPEIPKQEEKPIMNLVTSKNFIVANAVETILAAPKKLPEGAKDYLRKADFGKVPKYLQHIKNDIQAEYDYIRELQAAEEEARSNEVRLMTDEERQNLISGLKAKWEQVNTDYQATTHLTKLDTIGKVTRKEKFESELSQIEKDIERLNRKQILVDTRS